MRRGSKDARVEKCREEEEMRLKRQVNPHRGAHRYEHCLCSARGVKLQHMGASKSALVTNLFNQKPEVSLQICPPRSN